MVCACFSWATATPRILGQNDLNAISNNRREPQGGRNKKKTCIKKHSVIVRHLEASALEAALDIETLIDFGTVKNAL